MSIKQKSFLFGKKIRELRVLRGMLLRKTAADLDIDQAVLSKLENGLLFPNNTLTEKIAGYYKISSDDLKILLYADKIINDYGNYPYAGSVIKMVYECLTEYSVDTEKQEEKHVSV